MTLIISVNLGSSFCPKQHMHQKRLKHKHRCCLLSSLYWLHYWFGCLQLQDLTNNAAEYARLWLRREKESARQGKILSEHLMRMSHLCSVWPSIFWWVSKVYLPILPMNFFFWFLEEYTHTYLSAWIAYTQTQIIPHPPGFHVYSFCILMKDGEFCIQTDEDSRNSLMWKWWCPHHKILNASVSGYASKPAYVIVQFSSDLFMSVSMSWLQLATLSDRRPSERLELLRIRDTREVWTNLTPLQPKKAS